MGKFFGRTYRYKTPNDGEVTIGVCQGLGGEIWIVGYRRQEGVSTRRVKTSNLPPTTDPDHLQMKLDAWASRRGLKEVA